MNNINQNIGRQSRDELLGKSLARALSEAGASGNCLSDEDLAALLDRTTAADEQELLQAHIVSCNDCLARYTLASKLHVRQVQTGRRAWYGYAAGLTAVAAALVAVIMTRQQPDVQTAQNVPQASTAPAVQGTPQERTLQASIPPEKIVPRSDKDEHYRLPAPTPSAAVALAEGVYDSVPNASTARRIPAKSYGFSGAITPVKVAFRTGVAAVDLAAALKSGDTTARSGAVERLVDLIGKDSDAMGIRALLQEGAPAEVRQQYLNVFNKIEEHAGKRGQGTTFRFGAWSEAGRLADSEKLREFVDRASIRTFSEGIKGEDMSESVRRSLEKLDALVASPSSTEKDIRLIKRALDAIVELY